MIGDEEVESVVNEMIVEGGLDPHNEFHVACVKKMMELFDKNVYENGWPEMEDVENALRLDGYQIGKMYSKD